MMMRCSNDRRRRSSVHRLEMFMGLVWATQISMPASAADCDPADPPSMAFCNVCNQSHVGVLLNLAQQISLASSWYVVKPGQTVDVQGAGFTLLPPTFAVRFGSRIPAVSSVSGCPTGGSTNRHDRSPAATVVSDTLMRVQIPATVREGIGVFRIEQPGECLIASAGNIITADRSVAFETSKRIRYEVATPAFPATEGLTIVLDFGGYLDHEYPLEEGSEVAFDIPRFTQPALISEIVRRVQEDFEPFDVSVTAVDPGDIEGHPERGIRVAIGGTIQQPACSDGIDNDADGQTDADIAAPDSHCEGRWWWNNEASASSVIPMRGPTQYGVSTHPGSRNVAVVAEFDHAGAISASDIAQTISHELGHTFGFMIGFLLSHYQIGHSTPNVKTPLLGAKDGARSTWFKHDNVILGFSLCTNNYISGPQDDFATLLSALGAAEDDHPDGPELGTPLEDAGFDSSNKRVLELEGVVSMNSASWPQCAPRACPAGTPTASENDDRDFFRFEVTGGRFDISAQTLDKMTGFEHSGNLEADLELWIYRNTDVGWERLLDSANKATGGNDAALSWPDSGSDAEAGLYAIAVKSKGGIGDLGRYGVQARGPYINVLGPD